MAEILNSIGDRMQETVRVLFGVKSDMSTILDETEKLLTSARPVVNGATFLNIVLYLLLAYVNSVESLVRLLEETESEKTAILACYLDLLRHLIELEVATDQSQIAADKSEDVRKAERPVKEEEENESEANNHRHGVAKKKREWPAAFKTISLIYGWGSTPQVQDSPSEGIGQETACEEEGEKKNDGNNNNKNKKGNKLGRFWTRFRKWTARRRFRESDKKCEEI